MTLTPNSPWPDALTPPDGDQTRLLPLRFWHTLEPLPDLLERKEWLLVEQITATLRHIVLEMMLAMNGIAYPSGTLHLNGYLGESQRAAIERTLMAPTVEAESWIGRAVALIVIYRWYAPQIAERFGADLPIKLEQRVLDQLAAHIPDWPATIETE